MKFFALILCLALSQLYLPTASAQSLSHKTRVAPKALLFDVMGTCVEIEKSLVEEGEQWGKAHGISGDWESFAQAWIEDHVTAVQEISDGQLGWLSIDAIHQRNLKQLAARYLDNGDSISEDEISQINQFWHHLSPWPDSVQGFELLHQHFKLVAFSNADTNLLRDMSLSAGLPWDEYVSADEIHHYKPDTEFYQFAEQKLALSPSEMMLVAAHVYDVKAAQKLGWQTALIERPGEDDYEGVSNHFDYVATDLVDLANQMSGGQQ